MNERHAEVQRTLLTALLIVYLIAPFRIPGIELTPHGIILLISFCYFAVTDARAFRPGPYWPFIGFALALAASWIAARGQVDFGTVRALGFGVLAAFLVAIYLKGPSALRAIFGLGAATVVLAVVVAVQYTAAALGAPVFRLEGLLWAGLSPFHSGLFFVVALPIIGLAAIRKESRALYLLLIPLWMAVVISGLRGLWVGAGVTVAVFGLAAQRARHTAAVCALAILSFGAVAGLTQTYLTRVGYKLTDAQLPGDQNKLQSQMTLRAGSLAAKATSGIALEKLAEELTWSGRLGYWMTGVKIWSTSPVFGVGPGNFARQSEPYVLQLDDRRDAEIEVDAHNMFVSILAELGSLGLAVLAALIVIPVVRWGRCWRQSPGSQDALAAMAAVFAGLTAVGLTWDIHIQRLWWITLGLLWGTTVVEEREHRPRERDASVVSTVLVTLRYGLVARTLFRAGFLDELRRSGLKVVFVCPAAREEYLVKEVTGPQVRLEPFPKIRTSVVESCYEGLSDALLFDHPGTTFTMTMKWRKLLIERQYMSFVLKGVLSVFRLHRSSKLRQLAEWVDRRVFRHPEVGEVLDRHDPAIVVTTDLFSVENHFVREAARRGIPSVCFVKSWDNLTSKTRIRVHPDRIAVWSELQRDEAASLHFFPRDRVDIIGAPNFDFFRQVSFPRTPRDEFMRSISADPSAKLIVYSPGYKLTVSDDQNLRTIHRILHSGVLPYACHLHVRKYPKSPQDFSHLVELSDFSVEDAGKVVNSWFDRVDQSREEMFHLGDLMSHADVLVHIGSTIAVDACCFDTPVVGYFLDCRQPGADRNDYPPHVFDLTHNRHLVDLGCQRVVRTEEELVAALRLYLEKPQTDREGRAAVVDRICGKFDGRCSRRAAELVTRVMLSDQPAPGSLGERVAIH